MSTPHPVRSAKLSIVWLVSTTVGATLESQVLFFLNNSWLHRWSMIIRSQNNATAAIALVLFYPLFLFAGTNGWYRCSCEKLLNETSNKNV
jgi:hypothetical protein